MPPLAKLREECQVLCNVGNKPGHLRRCVGAGFLFVSDLPKHTSPEELREVMLSLGQADFICKYDKARELLFLDASLPRYECLLASLPKKPPPFPQDQQLHPLYALCSLLLLHPVPLAGQPIEPIRLVLKLTEGSVPCLLHAVPAMHQECAVMLRQRMPVPYAAGQVLAAWFDRSIDQ